MGSVLICPKLAQSAASQVLRIHSERDLLADLALASIAFNASTVKRTGTMRPLASPFGNLGRPTFLFFFAWLKASKLLYDYPLIASTADVTGPTFAMRGLPIVIIVLQ